jgi:hypothetical protein
VNAANTDTVYLNWTASYASCGSRCYCREMSREQAESRAAELRAKENTIAVWITKAG